MNVLESLQDVRRIGDELVIVLDGAMLLQKTNIKHDTVGEPYLVYLVGQFICLVAVLHVHDILVLSFRCVIEFNYIFMVHLLMDGALLLSELDCQRIHQFVLSNDLLYYILHGTLSIHTHGG